MIYPEKLRAALSQIKGTVDKEGVIDLTNKPTHYPVLCSTGSLGLDIALGGALPKGRIIEYFGQESSGKTTAALHAIADCQKKNPTCFCAFLDAEQAFDKAYALTIGIDLERLIFIQTTSSENYLQSLEILIDSGEIALFVVDSTNALVPQSELDGDAGELKVGLVARHMSSHLRKIVSSLNKSNSSIIYISQMREKIGVMWGDPNVIGVGNAMKFYASIRVGFQIIERLKNGEDYIGNRVKATVKKNKLAPPFKVAIYDLMYGEGISQQSEIIPACLEYGLLVKTGAGLELGFETPIWTGIIDTTEVKTMEALKREDLAIVYKELKLRLDAKLGKITEEEVTKELATDYEKGKENQEMFENYFKIAQDFSGKSKDAEAIYYFRLSLFYIPNHKGAQTKLKAVEKRASDKEAKGTKINWVIENENGEKINVQTNEVLKEEVIVSTGE